MGTVRLAVDAAGQDKPFEARRARSIPEGLRPYFEDVQDHALHVLTEMDTYRDLLGAALDVQVFSSIPSTGSGTS